MVSGTVNCCRNILYKFKFINYKKNYIYILLYIITEINKITIIFYVLFIYYRAPTVIVRVGRSLEYQIGKLSYASPNLMHGLSPNAMAGVIGCKHF